MAVFDKLVAARRAGDVKAYTDMMAEDCVFVRHQSGTSMNKGEVIELLDTMMKNGARFADERCLYENDDIMVVHSINDYPDGSREAVLSAYSLKDGRITRLETGATPLKV